MTHVQATFPDVMRSYAASGYNDSFFNALIEHGEDVMAGPDGDYDLVSPDVLNEKYGIPGQLKFDAPTTSRHAALLKRRKQQEIDRAKLMTSIRGGGVARAVVGFGSSVVGNIINPVDLGFSFIPVIGSAGKARSVIRGGGSFFKSMPRPVRHGLARFEAGLIPEERLAMIPFHKVVSSAIDAAVGNAIVEVPVFMQKMANQADYTFADSALNIVGGAVFGGGIRSLAEVVSAANLKLAKAIIDGASEEGRKSMAMTAMRDFLDGESVDVSRAVLLSDPAIKAYVDARIDIDSLRASAEATTSQASRSIIVEGARQAALGRATSVLEGGNVEQALASAIEEFEKNPTLETVSDVRAIAEASETTLSEAISRQLDEALAKLELDPRQAVDGARAADLSKQIEAKQNDLSRVDDSIKKILDDIRKSNRVAEKGPDELAELNKRVKQLSMLENERDKLQSDIGRLEYESMGGQGRDVPRTPEIERQIGAERARRVNAAIDNELQTLQDKYIREWARENAINPPVITPEEARNWQFKQGEDIASVKEDVNTLKSETGVEDEVIERHMAELKIESRHYEEPEAIKAAADCLLSEVSDV